MFLNSHAARAANGFSWLTTTSMSFLDLDDTRNFRYGRFSIKCKLLSRALTRETDREYKEQQAVDVAVLQFDNLQFVWNYHIGVRHRAVRRAAAHFSLRNRIALFAVFRSFFQLFMCATLWQMEDRNQGQILRASRALFRARESPSKLKIRKMFDNRRAAMI